MPCRISLAGLALVAPGLSGLFACRGTATSPTPASPGESVFYTFEKFEPGRLPAMWVDSCEPRAVDAGHPTRAEVDVRATHWQVSEVPGAPSGRRVLVHPSAHGDRTEGVVLRGAEYGAVKIHVFARTNERGNFALLWRLDAQGNGFALHVDVKNRRSTLERRLRGETTVLAEVPMAPPAIQWTAFSVVHSGDRIQCRIGGGIVLEARCEGVPERGTVGFCQYPQAGNVEIDNVSVIGETRP